ncbi:MAG: hypothetical protein BHV98_01455 [Clostridium sp. CAG:217_53_7]|nr:MAG: hypothetical protein BHV98_01455 [Clostridium sp. CAG:217_53_7]
MKQEEKNRRSRECIEEAAIRSFARQGPDNANLNQLCRENGISKGKLYHYTICLWLVCNALWIDWLLVYVHFRRIRSRVLLPICMCITRNALIFGVMTRKRCL